MRARMLTAVVAVVHVLAGSTVTSAQSMTAGTSSSPSIYAALGDPSDSLGSVGLAPPTQPTIEESVAPIGPTTPYLFPAEIIDLASYTSLLVPSSSDLDPAAINAASLANPEAGIPTAAPLTSNSTTTIAPVMANATVVNAPVASDPVADKVLMPYEINGERTCRESILSCCNMCPCRYGYVEGLIFTRNNKSINNSLIRDINTGDVLLSTGNSSFDWNGGMRAVVGKRYCDEYYFELGYFGLFDQTGSTTITGNNNLIVDGDLGLTVNNFGLADEVTLSYASRIHSVESNLLCCCCSCETPSCCFESAWLIGYRFLDFSERFSLISTDLQESTTDYTVRTKNQLYGGQIGRRLRACRGRWSLEALGKAGVYGNGASQTSAAIIDFPNFLFRPATSNSRSDVAFVGELNFTSIYHLNRTWGIRSGYNLLWLEGVALAPDQLDFTNTPNSGLAIRSDGETLLHGVSVGLEARW